MALAGRRRGGGGLQRGHGKVLEAVGGQGKGPGLDGRDNNANGKHATRPAFSACCLESGPNADRRPSTVAASRAELCELLPLVLCRSVQMACPETANPPNRQTAKPLDEGDGNACAPDSYSSSHRRRRAARPAKKKTPSSSSMLSLTLAGRQSSLKEL